MVHLMLNRLQCGGSDLLFGYLFISLPWFVYTCPLCDPCPVRRARGLTEWLDKDESEPYRRFSPSSKTLIEYNRYNLLAEQCSSLQYSSRESAAHGGPTPH